MAGCEQSHGTLVIPHIPVKLNNDLLNTSYFMHFTATWSQVFNLLFAYVHVTRNGILYSKKWHQYLYVLLLTRFQFTAYI